jgi:hypothetical protein
VKEGMMIRIGGLVITKEELKTKEEKNSYHAIADAFCDLYSTIEVREAKAKRRCGNCLYLGKYHKDADSCIAVDGQKATTFSRMEVDGIPCPKKDKSIMKKKYLNTK